ncbi:ATP-binding cassette domain-containing protein, partial [Methyloceanibacter marginalis]|uniref:ATP-binding cassette domain-containing protein n=1 Tax=Methyloceanibacter marginalis TaxID=1774971 RepID=UPI001FCCC9D6
MSHNSDKAGAQRKEMVEAARNFSKDGAGGSDFAQAPVVVRGLVKRYGAVTAVDHISFTIEAGTTVALLGGNGAGKTTTIAMLLGLIEPSAGEVRVF